MVPVPLGFLPSIPPHPPIKLSSHQQTTAIEQARRFTVAHMSHVYVGRGMWILWSNARWLCVIYMWVYYRLICQWHNVKKYTSENPVPSGHHRHGPTTFVCSSSLFLWEQTIYCNHRWLSEFSRLDWTGRLDIDFLLRPKRKLSCWAALFPGWIDPSFSNFCSLFIWKPTLAVFVCCSLLVARIMEQQQGGRVSERGRRKKRINDNLWG